MAISRALTASIDQRDQDAVDEDGRPFGHLREVDDCFKRGSGASLMTALATDAAWSPIRSSS